MTERSIKVLLQEEKMLLDTIKNNANEGLTIAFDMYGKQIKTICKNILRNYGEEDVEEAISDCFVMLWKSIDKFDEERQSSLRIYFYGIARNVAVDRYRKLSKNETLPLDDLLTANEENIEVDFDKKQAEEILHKVVDEMEEYDRSIFILRYFYFEKISEIARKLNLTNKKVENSLYRGKEKLKNSLLKGGFVR